MDAPIPPVIYFPFNQSPDTGFALVVRTSRAEGPIVSMLAAAIHGIDPDIVSVGGMTMTDRVSDSQSAYLHRSLAWLVGGFAVLALLMGVVGL